MNGKAYLELKVDAGDVDVDVDEWDRVELLGKRGKVVN